MSLHARTRGARRRGALLLELLLAVALFAGAGTLCLAASKSVFRALDRSRRESEALDLVRSKMAELEAGLINTGDLREEWSGAVGSFEPEDLDEQPRWSFDVQTSRTPFAGLSLVELTVFELAERPDAVSMTLRQLVALRETDVEAYEPDELLEGLPGVEP